MPQGRDDSFSHGGNGSEGLPIDMLHNGGAGQSAMMPCESGQIGAKGLDGAPGAGARRIGNIDATGYQGPSAFAGGPATPGQGGGGGGGDRGGPNCGPPIFAGASGGGGGAGGCPGLPGSPGQSGGSSIGLIGLNAKLTLKKVSITTKGGGAGGFGGNGQQGGGGGNPGQADSGACSGGPGAPGGNGGPGGGGAGGHSVGIAIKGGALPDLVSTTIQYGNNGLGGLGGDGDKDMNSPTRGDDGRACKTLDFGNPMSPQACAM
jgi:hypothetical protein